MSLSIVMMVWGDEYVERMLNFALPSLLSPGNLPELARMGLDARFNILTNAREAQTIAQSAVFAQIKELLPARIFELPAWDYSGPACAAQNFVQGHVLKTVRELRQTVLFCSPDVVWTDGSLRFVGDQLRNGRTVIYLPSYRVTDETIRHDEELTSHLQRGVGISSLLGGQLLMRHAHPLLGAFHYQSMHCPIHIEYVTWPVRDEGVMMYHLVRGPDCYTPTAVDWTGQELVSEKNLPEHVKAVDDSLDALGLSLTPLTQCSNWIINGRPSTTTIFGQFMARHHASLYGLLQPVKVPRVRQLMNETWLHEGIQAERFMQEVLERRNAIFRGEAQPEHPANMPQSYGGELSSDECQLYLNLLRWVPGDCATRRLLERMAGDGW